MTQSSISFLLAEYRESKKKRMVTFALKEEIPFLGGERMVENRNIPVSE
jgi:hypothetical protein